MPPEPRLAPPRARWAGPALLLLGGGVVAWLTLRNSAGGDMLERWVLVGALGFERVLPLAGLGVALALVPALGLALSLAAFAVGAAAGWEGHRLFIALMAPVPHAAEHLFLAGPVAAVASGLALLAPSRLRPALALPVAALLGFLHMAAMRLTDPTLYDPRVGPIGALAGAWVLLAVTLTVRAFRPRWAPIGARILGSWLLAIGLLYGAASTVPPRRAVAPPPPPAPSPAPALPGPSAPRPNPFAGPAAEELFPQGARPAMPFREGSPP
ncbi:hypothetical protein [Aureimonas sp. AU20]|uniref:hypothetical protein n=1 Tax=Aureimonas sp. AU20 TaxID=1349819 RepID=UPI000720FCAF|nr:hypothetical protein [Aureimonas sp. AU20]ALN71808.1 hypothetical protein M673_03725 [Aureimonas sp. AU20]